MNSLRSQSPALFTQIEKLLPAQNIVQDLCTLYELSCARGGCEEIGFTRAPGASFNPRPARICSILLNYAENKDEALLGTAILACANLPIPTLPHQYHSLQQDGILLQQITTQPDQHSEISSALAIGALAAMLDNLRHFHLRTDRLEVRDEVYNNAEKLFSIAHRYEIPAQLEKIYDKALQRIS